MKSFLFLCTGNLCRSPMAAAFFEKALGERRCRVLASGLDATPEQPPFDLTIKSMQEIGIDISDYRSAVLTPRMVETADYIFCMTQRHVDWTNKEFPGAADKVFLLREFDDSLPPEDRDIRDPLGGNLDTHRLCRDEVQQAIDFLVKYLDRGDVLSDDDDGLMIDSAALGSDHAGLELKEILKEHLQKRPIRIKDFGPASDLAADYPDYAKPVAESVADGDYELGILVCGSGIGMSIAANKQPGVRAALVFDEEMARLARRHNNANVLCLGARNTSPEQAIRMIDAYLESHFEGGRHQRRISKIETRT